MYSFLDLEKVVLQLSPLDTRHPKTHYECKDKYMWKYIINFLNSLLIIKEGIYSFVISTKVYTPFSSFNWKDSVNDKKKRGQETSLKSGR